MKLVNVELQKKGNGEVWLCMDFDDGVKGFVNVQNKANELRNLLPGKKQVWCKIEEHPDRVSVDGVCFSREIFKYLSDTAHVGSLFRFLRLVDGVVTVECVDRTSGDQSF